MEFPSSLHLCGGGSFHKHFFAAIHSLQPRKQVGNLRNKSKSWWEENIDCLKLPIANLISATLQISFGLGDLNKVKHHICVRGGNRTVKG